MTPEAWATNLGAMFAAGYAAWEASRARRSAGSANDNAELAATRSEPTSNGFARGVLDRLDRIERKTDHNTELHTQHLGDHARADLYRRDKR